MPSNRRGTNSCTIADSSTKRSGPPLRSGSGTTRGSERGACRIAWSASRPKASSPSTRTMKLRLLFWMRGNGRDGSSASGVSTGSTSCSKKLREPGIRLAFPFRARDELHARRAQRRQQLFVEAGVLLGDQARGAPVDRRSAAPPDRARPGCAAGRAGTSSSCLMPATRISKNSSRLLEEMQRNFSRSSSGTDSSCACASTRWLNSSIESSRLIRWCGALRSGASKRSAAAAAARPVRVREADT